MATSITSRFAIATLILCVGAPALAQQALDRTVLPIPEPNYPQITTLDARDATTPPRFEIKAPNGAPNVLVILVDDMGS